MRPGPEAFFDAFYLLWALTLRVVRDQWRRVVFMQTNREDVGDRYHEIEIPLAPDAVSAHAVSQSFREYFLALATAREGLSRYLASGEHHFFVPGAETGGSVTMGSRDTDRRETRRQTIIAFRDTV